MTGRRYNDILFLILLGGGVFASSAFFVSPEISTKYHFVVLLALAGGAWVLGWNMRGSAPIRAGAGLCWASLFTAWIVIRAVFPDQDGVRAVLPFVCGWLLFFIGYQQPENKAVAFEKGSIVVGGIAAAQALYGLYPLIGYGLHGGSFPTIEGSFDNPAGYAACLACLLPACLFNVRHAARGWKGLWIAASLPVVAGIILSGSRTGLLATGCMAILYGKLYYPSLKVWKKHFSRLLFIIPFLVAGLYFIRPDSADGRLLIWRCTLSLIHDHPFAGSGPHGFQGNYMPAQADYFQNNPEDGRAILADNVLHPFNEWLALTAGYGIVALLLLALVVYHLFRAGSRHLSEEKKIALLVLAGIAVFGCFSYPFRYAFTWVSASWCLATLTKDEKVLFRITGATKTTLLILLVVIALFCLRIEWRLLTAEHAWYRVAESPEYRLKRDREIVREYADIHRKLRDHPLFLFSYGTELYRRERHEESISILQACTKGLNDAEVQLLLAMNYIALKRWDPAEASLGLASRMCPNRFAPLVGLMRVYAASNRVEEARAIARIIISKEIKVVSPRVILLIDEAKQFLNASQQSHSTAW